MAAGKRRLNHVARIYFEIRLMLSRTAATRWVLQVFNYNVYNINFVKLFLHAMCPAYFNAHDFITSVTTAADYDAS